MNKNSFRIVAAGCYAASAIMLLLSNIIYRYQTYDFDNTIGIVFFFIGLVLVAVSLIIDQPVVRWIGIGLSLLACILMLRIHVLYYMWWGGGKFTNFYREIIVSLYLIAYWIIFLIWDCGKKSNKLLVIAAIFPILRIVTSAIGGLYDSDFGLSVWKVSFFSFVFYVALSTAGVLLYLYSSRKAVALDVEKESIIKTSKPTINSSAQVVEQLEKLKALLDKGIITQDEFEAQKARVLSHK